MKISQRARKEALALARWILETRIGTDDPPRPTVNDKIFGERFGLFVTLRNRGELKGCVGRIEPLHRLQDEILDLTIGSATRDPRFSPVTPEEISQLTIEISILSPPVVVEDPTTLRIGMDGLIVEKGHRRGLLLPQVALEEGWDVESFLLHGCLKAGLPPDSWKDGDTTVYRFSAQVFSD